MEATPDPREQANEIFADALELAPDQRAPFVERQCGSNSGLRDSVMRLLSRFDKLGDFLDQPAVDFGGASTRELRPGVVLADRFRVVELIGRGGMGEVYRADDLTLGEPAALKIIRAEWRLDPGLMARFREEIRIARRIADPHVCKVFDVFTATLDGAPVTFFSMEYLEGEPLSEVLKRNPKMEPEAALRVAGGIAAGLDAAHLQGVIHRDLKPANIMLLRDRPVIMDFGLAKSTERLAGSMTERGLLVGTPAYMAPEQFLEEPLTPATDVYAFGLILYEMIAGTEALSSSSLFRTAVLRLTSDGVPRGRMAADVPKGWERVLRRALARDPAKRYQSAGELARELRQGPGVVRLPSRRAVLISAGASAVSVSLFLGWRRFQKWGHVEAPVIMLMPIEAPNPVQADAEPRAALAFDVQLEKGIQQSAFLRVLGREQIVQGWKLMSPNEALPGRLTQRQAREIALRKGAALLFYGEMYRFGSAKWGVKVTLEQLGSSAEHPRDSVGRDFTAENEEGLLKTAAIALDWIRETAGEKREELAARSRVPEEITTRNWEALKEYAEGDRAWQSGNPAAADDHLRKALELDPEFALAAARLADTQRGSGRLDEGLRNWSLAASIIDRRNLTDRESFRIRGLFAQDIGKFEEADRVYGRWITRYASDSMPLLYRATVLAHLGKYEQAERNYNLAIEREPGYVFRMNRALFYLSRGRLDEAGRDYQLAGRINTQNWTPHGKMALAVARADTRGVETALDEFRAETVPEDRSRAWAVEACWLAERGDRAGAERTLHEGLTFDRSTGQSMAAQFQKKLLLAQLLLPARPAEAGAIAREVTESEAGYSERMRFGCILARAGDVAGAERCRVSDLPDWPVYRILASRLEGEIAFARADYGAALTHFGGAIEPPTSFRWPDFLVRAAIAAGDDATAGETLRRLFEYAGVYWLGDPQNTPGFLRQAMELTRRLAKWPFLTSYLDRYQILFDNSQAPRR